MSILCLVLIKGLLEKTGKHHYQKEVSRSFMEVRGPFFPRIFTSKLHVHISHGHLEERKLFQLLCLGRALVAAFISTSVTGTLGALVRMCVYKKLTEITVLLTICFLTLDFQGILHRRRLRGPGVRVREPQQQQHEPVHLRGRGAQVLLVPGERAVLQPRRGRQ